MNNQKIHHILKTNGLRVTSIREAILDAFLSAKSPSSIKDLKKKKSLKSVDESSLYRNLKKLEENQVIKAIPSPDEFQHYELVHAHEGHHHHHIVCTKCQKVQCLDICQIEKPLENMAKSAGFAIKDHSLQLFGVCLDCQ